MLCLLGMRSFGGKGGYDLTLGTSERGTNVDDIDHTALGEHTSDGNKPKYKPLPLVRGI